MVCRSYYVIAALLVACVDKGKGPQPKKIDPGYIADHLLKAAPSDLSGAGNVAIGTDVEYLGNRPPTTAVVPGTAFRITHYWRVIATPNDNWRVFTHVRGALGTSDFSNADGSDMRIGYGPQNWKPGDIIADEQEITLPPNWRSKTAAVVVGLYQKGKHRISDRAVIKSPRATDNSLTVAELAVDIEKAPPPPGTVVLKKSAQPIVVDGVASEPAWTLATTSPEFLSAEGSPDVTGTAVARMTWDDNNLYLFATVSDSDIYSEYKTHDDPLWKADCIEMFIDADGNRSGYVELQWNPNNARFDSWFATTRAQAGDVSFDSVAVSAVKLRGTGDVSGDTDQGWDIEVAIPWAAVKGKDDGMRIKLPPTPGDRFHLNVVRVDKRGDTTTASSWSRIPYSDFHALDRMLTVVFADDNPKPDAGSGSGSASTTGVGSAAGSSAGSGIGSAPSPIPSTLRPGGTYQAAGSGNVVAPTSNGSGVLAPAKPR
jgi:hypothetical protein